MKLKKRDDPHARTPVFEPLPQGSKTVLTCVVGSTLHGTAVDDGLEDTDYMSIIIEPPLASRLAFKVYGDSVAAENRETFVQRTKPEGVRSEAGDIDHVIHTLRKYLRLALRNNPTILLALFAPDDQLQTISDEGLQLRNLAPQIISKQAYSSFMGYVHQQHERLMDLRGQKNVTRPELVAKYGFDSKYAGHILRLGYQGVELLRTGRITLPMPPKERDVVVAARTGAYTLPQISKMIDQVELDLSLAHRESTLPDQPDFRAVNEAMIGMYLNVYATGLRRQRRSSDHEDEGTL